MVFQYVKLQGISVRSAIRTEQARVRFLSRMHSYVVGESIFSARAIGTVRTKERFLSSMCAYVFGHVIFPIRGIATEGALVKLADASPPAKPRTITVQSHLLGTPILIIVINYSNRCCHINMVFRKCEQTHSKSCGTPHITPPRVPL